MTTPERWARIEQLYHEVLGLAATERGSFLADACAGDDTLREEVESLLAHDGGAAFLSTPAVSNSRPGGLGIGQKLGPYVISAGIGEGGMGEVYRARDTKLGRDVAIKILPPALTADPNRLARFEREARLLASLNDPHIGAIYGVEESDGVPALVLELVEGVTLADKLARGEARVEGLPVPEALAIARQIADALDAAHERGIVHRDLKPANIKITPAGTVKVLDFGLAKVSAVDGSGSALSRSPAMSVGHTRDGMILGTAAYMSPEQARGQVVDKRADIWAFGCVFYELLTGRPAFARATFSDTMRLSWPMSRTGPPSADDTTVFVAPAQTVPGEGFGAASTGYRRRTSRARGGGATVGRARAPQPDTPLARAHGRRRWSRGRRPPCRSVCARRLPAPRASPRAQTTAVRFSVFPPQSSRFLHNAGTTFLALSPDGSQLAFVAVAPPNPPQVWLRPISELEARVVPGTEGASSVFWSPDGRSLAFFAGGKLKRIDLPGGPAVPLCDVPEMSHFGTWGSNGTILFAPFLGTAIFRVPSTWWHTRCDCHA